MSATGQVSTFFSRACSEFPIPLLVVIFVGVLCGLVCVGALYLTRSSRAEKCYSQSEPRGNKSAQIASDQLLQSVQALIIQLHLAKEGLKIGSEGRAIIERALDDADIVLFDVANRLAKARMPDTAR